jgi:hypothetical protein
LVQSTPKDPGDLAFATHEIVDARNAVVRWLERPHPQIARPSARHGPGLQQMVQCGMGGMRIGSDASGDLAGVQLLPRHAHEEVERSSRGRASTEELSDGRHAAMLQQSL